MINWIKNLFKSKQQKENEEMINRYAEHLDRSDSTEYSPDIER